MWHMPAFTLTIFFHQTDPSEFDKLSALFGSCGRHSRFEWLCSVDTADIVDWLAMICIPILTAYIGVRTVRRAGMEFESWKPADRLAVFIGRITMMLIVLPDVRDALRGDAALCVRSAPTLWANEMSLWLAGFRVLVLRAFMRCSSAAISELSCYMMQCRAGSSACVRHAFPPLLIVTVRILS